MTWYYGKCKTDDSQYGFYANSDDCNDAVTVSDADYETLMSGCTCAKRISPDGNGYPVLTNDGYTEAVDDKIRKIYISTAAPVSTDGANGDVWIKY